MEGTPSDVNGCSSQGNTEEELKNINEANLQPIEAWGGGCKLHHGNPRRLRSKIPRLVKEGYRTPKIGERTQELEVQESLSKILQKIEAMDQKINEIETDISVIKYNMRFIYGSSV